MAVLVGGVRSMVCRWASSCRAYTNIICNNVHVPHIITWLNCKTGDIAESMTDLGLLDEVCWRRQAGPGQERRSEEGGRALACCGLQVGQGFG